MTRRDLSRRSSEAEMMDDEGVDYDTLHGCLRDLERVNHLSLGYRPTLSFLEGLRRMGRLDLGRPVRILDVGSGHGDMLRQVAAWARRRGVAVHLTGLDLSPWSARAAREAPGSEGIEWLTGDIFAHEGAADVIISALFTHHLPDPLVTAFLRWMEDRATLGWFVNDLHRHPLPHAAFGPMAAALGMHPFVRHDGPVSFARSFVPADWQRHLGEAGIPPGAAQVQRVFPFRLCVARDKAA